MPEYRVTRPEVYGVHTLGYNNVCARQGHYVRDAPSHWEAAAEVFTDFPDDDILDVQEGKPAGKPRRFMRDGFEMSTDTLEY